MNWTTLLITFCALSFFGYGWSCLFTNHMVAEFERYHLSNFRRLTGIVQLIGAAGLATGILLPWVGGLAAAGISLQMACGLGVRVRIGDSWLQCLPATSYMILCGWLATQLL
ncbi:MAG: DoxX family protein [Opitutaceae bacterium]